MDRPLASKVRIRRIVRRTLMISLGVACVLVALLTLPGWMRPSLEKNEIRTALVERGQVDQSIAASGKVVPEYEHVITSPVDSRVTEILLAPGAEVDPGQPIVRLHTSEARTALEKLEDQISLKRNEREKILLDDRREQTAVITRRRIKELELQSRRYEAERCRNYFNEGLFSQDEVRKAETDAEKAEIELLQIDETLANMRETLDRRLRGLDLEIAIFERDRNEARRRLEQSTASSDRRGVLTWTVSSEGMAVSRGDELARIADLSAYRVEATVSDIHASRLAPGMPVQVRTGEHRLSGSVAGIRPVVENGIVTMEIDLDDSDNPVLRHNLRVEVFVVTELIDDALRIKRGTYRMRDGKHAAFVVRGDRAVRTDVRFGLTNLDYYQVLDGLNEGDEVVVSDMSDYMHVREVKLK